jgi:toxin FitB
MTLNYLLDTCVISEFVKPKPERRVLEWLNGIDAERVYLSVVTLGEIQRGISEKPASNRRTELEEWLNTALVAQFTDRILSLDGETFLTWGQMTAALKAQGKPMSVMDSLIAATALHHKMVLVTRNVTDFANVDLNIFNPWE